MTSNLSWWWKIIQNLKWHCFILCACMKTLPKQGRRHKPRKDKAHNLLNLLILWAFKCCVNDKELHYLRGKQRGKTNLNCTWWESRIGILFQWGSTESSVTSASPAGARFYNELLQRTRFLFEAAFMLYTSSPAPRLLSALIMFFQLNSVELWCMNQPLLQGQSAYLKSWHAGAL